VCQFPIFRINKHFDIFLIVQHFDFSLIFSSSELIWAFGNTQNLAALKAFKYDLSCVLQRGNVQLLQQGLIRVHRQQHIRNDKAF
jgi:hypothetical protein